MNKMLAILVVVFLFLLNSTPVFVTSQIISYANNGVDTVDDFILNEMQTKHIPGLSASIVIDDAVVWQNAYGYADIEQYIHVTNETLCHPSTT